jgi:hypothetical protein
MGPAEFGFISGYMSYWHPMSIPNSISGYIPVIIHRELDANNLEFFNAGSSILNNFGQQPMTI